METFRHRHVPSHCWRLAQQCEVSLYFLCGGPYNKTPQTPPQNPLMSFAYVYTPPINSPSPRAKYPFDNHPDSPPTVLPYSLENVRTRSHYFPNPPPPPRPLLTPTRAHVYQRRCRLLPKRDQPQPEAPPPLHPLNLRPKDIRRLAAFVAFLSFGPFSHRVSLSSFSCNLPCGRLLPPPSQKCTLFHHVPDCANL